MEYRRFDHTIVARLDKGEEILEQVKPIALQEHITLATVQALGAINAFTVGVFYTDEKEYHANAFTGHFEIVSLSGTINTMDGDFYSHLHMSAGNEKGQVFGGHLNRAIIVEAEAVPNADIVNVVPQPKAGGSFATAAYHGLEHPVAVEEIKADAGLDIGATLIGMHLKKVAVPVRLQVKQIGQAPLTAARVRPKFIGGVRAVYDQTML